MIKPTSDRWYTTTDIAQIGRFTWWWKATCQQPWPEIDSCLDSESGTRRTQKGAQRAAARAEARMRRTAETWTTTEKARGSR